MGSVTSVGDVSDVVSLRSVTFERDSSFKFSCLFMKKIKFISMISLRLY